MTKPLKALNVNAQVTGMNVPIRMLGVASVICWVVFIVFVASAAYSLRYVQFSLGELQYSVTSDGSIACTLPININNLGYYSLKAFNVTTIVFDGDTEVVKASTFVPRIAQGQNVTVLHNATLSRESLQARAERFMFNDFNLTLQLSAGLAFAELLPSQVSANISVPWGAPLHNFSLGQPAFNVFNATYVEVHEPFSFDNHAVFDVVGNVRVKLYENTGRLICEGQADLHAAKGTRFTGTAVFYAPASAVPALVEQHVYAEVSFSVGSFEYGPLVVHYG